MIEGDENDKMVGFEEKPSNPKSIPGEPEWALVSMGNYIFEAETLSKELREDAENNQSSHDFGKDIIPKMFPRGKVYVYDFTTNKIKERRNRPTGVMWVPLSPTGRHIWICSTKIQNFRYTTAAGRCTPTILLCRLRRLWMSKTRKSKSQIA